jgi:CRP-like cAMP-binding protein
MTASPTGHPGGPRPDPVFIRSVELEDLTARKLFKGVKKEDLKRLLHNSYSRICKLEARQRLWPSRRGIDHVYVILNGFVVISARSRFRPDVEDKTFLAWRGPEQVIGEMPKDSEPTPATILACDTCELLEMTKEMVMGFLAEKNPIIHRNIANLLLEKMASERRRSDVIQTLLIEMQVAQTLIYLSEERCPESKLKASGPIEIPGPIHQEELGAFVGATRGGVNRPLSAFKKASVITYTRAGKITILDRDELNEIAMNPDRAKLYRS